MRTTLTLDDELLADAQEYSGIKEKSALVNAALKSLIQREATQRLARMGGTEQRPETNSSSATAPEMILADITGDRRLAAVADRLGIAA